MLFSCPEPITTNSSLMVSEIRWALEAIPAFEEKPVAFFGDRRRTAVPTSTLKQVRRQCPQVVCHGHAFLSQ